jgi:hypothetical protein
VDYVFSEFPGITDFFGGSTRVSPAKSSQV